jgi:hypothetical protein
MAGLGHEPALLLIGANGCCGSKAVVARRVITMPDTETWEATRATGQNSCAEVLVADGCPDQPWQALGTNGMCCLHGSSLHGLTKWTIQESSSQPIRRVPYVPLPEGAFRRRGSSKDGAEASAGGDGAGVALAAC